MRAIERRSSWRILLDRLASPVVALLAVAMTAAFAFATPLEERLRSPTAGLIRLTTGLALVVAVALRASGHDWLLAVELAIARAVATIPEGLSIVATVAEWRLPAGRVVVGESSSARPSSTRHWRSSAWWVSPTRRACARASRSPLAEPLGSAS